MTSRRTRTTEVRIYKYGCKRPGLAIEQMIQGELRAANDYYNALVEIERRKRETFRVVRRAAVPGLDEAEARLTEIESELTNAYNAKRGGDGAADVVVESLKVERLALNEKARGLKAEFDARLEPGRAVYEGRTSGAPAELLARVEMLKGQLGAAKKIRRNPDVPKLKRAIGDLKREMKTHGESTHKKAAVNARVLTEMLSEPEWPIEWRTIAQAEAAAVREIKMARAAKRVGSATSLLVERAVDAARRSPADPRFRRYDGQGRVGGQVANGLTVAGLFGGDSGLVRMSPVVRDGSFAKSDLTLALGEDEAGVRKRVMLSVRWHRELPSDARITWVWILVRKLGHELRYELQFTLEATGLPKRAGRSASGVAELHLGWASIDSGLRVARFVGDDGGNGECVLPADVVERLNHREASLRKISDAHFNRDVHPLFVETIERWMKDAPLQVPDWITAIPQSVHGKEMKPLSVRMHFWKSHVPLASIAHRWARELLGESHVNELWRAWRLERDGARLVTDLPNAEPSGADYFCEFAELATWLSARGIVSEPEQLVCYLEWWRRKEEHLVGWGAHQTDRAARHRRQVYRDWTIGLAMAYHQLQVHDVALDKTARDRTPEDKAPRKLDSLVRSQQRDAAPSEMRHALLEVFGKENVKLISPTPKRERLGGGESPVAARNGTNIAGSRAAHASE